MNLKNKNVLITGAASGIGLATAKAFSAGGARVALNFLPDDARGQTEVDNLCRAGGFALAAPGNISSPQEAVVMVNGAISALGGLDYLVNNAGTPGTSDPIPFSDFDKLTEDFWQTILSTNLIGPFRCTSAAASALRASKGAVVNTASVAGLGLRSSSLGSGPISHRVQVQTPEPLSCEMPCLHLDINRAKLSCSSLPKNHKKGLFNDKKNTHACCLRKLDRVALPCRHETDRSASP